MKRLTLFAVALAVFSVAAARSHASIQYTFTGVIPVGAIDTNANVAIGESWTATFLIDDSVPNTGNATVGLYTNAVLGGTLTFSGGYVSPLDFTGLSVEIYKTAVDSVHVFGMASDGINSFYNAFQVVAASGALPTTALPPAGTVLGPGYNGSTGYVQLTYDDALVGGTVDYRANLDNNVSFVASAVPEPMSLLVWTALGGSIAAVYSYRRATK